MSFSSDELGKLGYRLAEAGPAAVHDELAELASRASTLGVDPLLLELMCDEREPVVVRQRAFARVAAQCTRFACQPAIHLDPDMIIAEFDPMEGDELGNDHDERPPSRVYRTT